MRTPPPTHPTTPDTISQLTNSEEYIDGVLAGTLGEILIRCNNVLHVRLAPAAPGAAAAAEAVDASMGGGAVEAVGAT